MVDVYYFPKVLKINKWNAKHILHILHILKWVGSFPTSTLKLQIKKIDHISQQCWINQIPNQLTNKFFFKFSKYASSIIPFGVGQKNNQLLKSRTRHLNFYTWKIFQNHYSTPAIQLAQFFPNPYLTEFFNFPIHRPLSHLFR